MAERHFPERGLLRHNPDLASQVSHLQPVATNRARRLFCQLGAPEAPRATGWLVRVCAKNDAAGASSSVALAAYWPPIGPVRKAFVSSTSNSKPWGRTQLDGRCSRFGGGVPSSRERESEFLGSVDEFQITYIFPLKMRKPPSLQTGEFQRPWRS